VSIQLAPRRFYEDVLKVSSKGLLITNDLVCKYYLEYLEALLLVKISCRLDQQDCRRALLHLLLYPYEIVNQAGELVHINDSPAELSGFLKENETARLKWQIFCKGSSCEMFGSPRFLELVMQHGFSQYISASTVPMRTTDPPQTLDDIATVVQHEDYLAKAQDADNIQTEIQNRQCLIRVQKAEAKKEQVAAEIIRQGAILRELNQKQQERELQCSSPADIFTDRMVRLQGQQSSHK
jgi:hypothetical protein